ncbi:10828_t:CDS:2 [Diversispora eburnea]|uniref:EKC/KEOPS complex subunit CGI121 n=1 Tax=Diversispora eburnea TaxID=1213867 RepID=A0A9N8ZZ70_9GLOM|nr:10828_t:CDS:2 [Diversispora eburnea]
MQTHSFELFPDRGLIHIFLFSEVKNSSELRKRLLSHDTELSYAFINARILDVFQLLIAINCALHNEKCSILKTRNINSEIVYNLSPNTNINEALRRFGISDDSTNIIVVKVGGEANEIKSHLTSLIQGTETSLENLFKFGDLGIIKKYYRVDNKVNDVKEILNIIVGSMAVKIEITADPISNPLLASGGCSVYFKKTLSKLIDKVVKEFGDKMILASITFGLNRSTAG